MPHNNYYFFALFSYLFLYFVGYKYY